MVYPYPPETRATVGSGGHENTLGGDTGEWCGRVGVTLFTQRLTLLLCLSSADCQLTRAPSGAETGNNRDCSVMSPVKRSCEQTGDCAWPGGAAPARSAQ